MYLSSWDKLCCIHRALNSNRAPAEHSSINIKMAWGTRASTEELFCQYSQDSLSHPSLTSQFFLGWTVIRGQNLTGSVLPALPVASHSRALVSEMPPAHPSTLQKGLYLLLLLAAW